MEEREFLTPEKKTELEIELNYLKTEKRVEILDSLAFAKSLGDLSENTEYHTSKEYQAKNETRISQIKVILKNAIIVEANTDGRVGIGSRVVLIKKNEREEKKYHIVGNEEADFALGKISFESPLGSALMGKRAKDEIQVKTPKGKSMYIIKNVI